ncbi:acyltransferase family protein [Microlunatus parietis]|uniref:Glucan biosynthesis protein C n=1 Tax=Microlunatus parietis TaxID=682979 RepID=A0A7Y9I470_9ACTN|nr:acyltransferase family protein [Microlunatus parietis]NYE69574.1 glucan biosynthesis protein C [Microlunatus parietis]
MTTTSPESIASTPSTTTRLHGLDALRAGALLLGIVLHGLIPFLPDGGWLVVDRYRSEAALAVVYLIHLFRMVLFMTLAGYFGRMVLQRRGPGAYVRDRALRIGLPAVAFWPLAVGSLALIAIAAGTLDTSTTTQAAPDVPGPLAVLMPGHLWFLVTLLQLVLVTVAGRAVLVRVLGRERSGRLAGRIGSVLASPAGVGIAALPYLAGLLLQGGLGDLGIQEPPTIVPVPGASVAYLGAFLTGWFLQARSDALPRVGGRWPVLLVLAAVLSVVGWFGPDWLPGPAASAVAALAGWAWTFGLLGLAVRTLRRERPAIRYLADASYWMYLLHLPLLVLIELGLRDLTWPIPVKLLIAFTGCTAVLLLTYDLLVRSTWIGRWLNGRRYRSALVRWATTWSRRVQIRPRRTPGSGNGS